MKERASAKDLDGRAKAGVGGVGIGASSPIVEDILRWLQRPEISRNGASLVL